VTEQLLEKLYNIGIINKKENILDTEKLSVSSVCRRRLPVVLQQLKFTETLREAVTFIEQGRKLFSPSLTSQISASAPRSSLTPAT